MLQKPRKFFVAFKLSKKSYSLLLSGEYARRADEVKQKVLFPPPKSKYSFFLLLAGEGAVGG